MKSYPKLLVQNLLRRAGYRLSRVPRFDLGLYDDFPVESLKNCQFYNVGAGLFFHPYWKNIDYESQHYSARQKHDFIHYDLMALEPFPIDSDSAELVYSSHTIEHVSDAAVANMLKDSCRILKPGGGIRLTTPDSKMEYRAFKSTDRRFFYWHDPYDDMSNPESRKTINPQLFLAHFASQLVDLTKGEKPISRNSSDREIIDVFEKLPMEEAFDHFTKQCQFDGNFPGRHMNWWTHEKAISFLTDAGFSDVYASAYGQSRFPPMRETLLFDDKHHENSLYVEAIK